MLSQFSPCRHRSHGRQLRSAFVTIGASLDDVSGADLSGVPVSVPVSVPVGVPDGVPVGVPVDVPVSVFGTAISGVPDGVPFAIALANDTVAHCAVAGTNTPKVLTAALIGIIATEAAASINLAFDRTFSRFPSDASHCSVRRGFGCRQFLQLKFNGTR